MKTIRERTNKQGKRVVTVEIDADEKLMSFKDERYYRLGGQVDEVMAGHVITDSDHVVWCSIGQEWVA
jgi:hypothetical protein